MLGLRVQLNAIINAFQARRALAFRLVNAIKLERTIDPVPPDVLILEPGHSKRFLALSIARGKERDDARMMGVCEFCIAKR